MPLFSGFVVTTRDCSGYADVTVYFSSLFFFFSFLFLYIQQFKASSGCASVAILPLWIGEFQGC